LAEAREQQTATAEILAPISSSATDANKVFAKIAASPAHLCDLTRVLLNLVGIAIKFTRSGEVRTSAGAEDGHFVLNVSNTGPGIPPGERERIFEKFRKVDSSDTRAEGGTGLGLAIAREVVEMHGGRIWAESRSKLGQGSTFCMELPVRAAAFTGAA